MGPRSAPAAVHESRVVIPDHRDVAGDGKARPPDRPDGYTDRDDVHDIYRSWRAIAGEYSGRVLIGEIWLPDADWVLSNHDVDRHVSRYGRADTSFGLDRRDRSTVLLASGPCTNGLLPPDTAVWLRTTQE